jgi:hypothetical protein
MQRLLQGIEDKTGFGAARHPPADEQPGEGVDDEGDVDEAGPGRNVGEIGHPKHVRPLGLEDAIHAVERTRHRLVANRGALGSSANDAGKPHLAHQPRHRAASGGNSFAAELAPHLAHTVDSEVLTPDPPDVPPQLDVAPCPRRRFGRIGMASGMSVIGRRGNRQHPADRLDPERITVRVDERDHGLDRRSSSAWAK